jgi:flagellar protein FlbD
MIRVTRFNGSQFYLNAELIQTVESTPDTVVTLTNNVKVLVRERAEEIIARIIDYQRLVHNPQLKLNLGE